QLPVGVILAACHVQPIQACIATRGDQGGIPVLSVARGSLKTDDRIVAPINSGHDSAGGAVIDAEQHSILLGTDEASIGCPLRQWPDEGGGARARRADPAPHRCPGDLYRRRCLGPPQAPAAAPAPPARASAVQPYHTRCA